MTERDILINNIILSEIGFIRKLEILGEKISWEEQEKISNSMEHDHEIIEYWCINYGITRDDLLKRRQEILEWEHISAKERLEDSIERRKNIKDNDFRIQRELRQQQSLLIKKIKIENKDTHRIIEKLKTQELLWQSIPHSLHDYSPQEQRGLVG